MCSRFLASPPAVYSVVPVLGFHRPALPCAIIRKFRRVARLPGNQLDCAIGQPFSPACLRQGRSRVTV
jgi:hypothetical protein